MGAADRARRRRRRRPPRLPRSVTAERKSYRPCIGVWQKRVSPLPRSAISHRERAELEALPDEPSEALDAVADLFLNPKNGTKNDRVVMLDLAGQTIQNRALRKAQANHDRAVKKALAGVFKKTPRTAGVTAVDAAHSAYAMLNGLRTTSFFDSSLSGLQAHKLFRSTLYQLAGIANGRAKRATRAAS